MKVLVKHFLNVRVGKPSVNASCYQYIAPGSIVEVDGRLYKGDTFEGIDTWLKDDANNYYWSGGVNFTVDAGELLKNSAPSTTKKIAFNWFKKLQIEPVWTTYNERGEAVTIAVLDTGYNPSMVDVSGGIVQNKIFIDAKNYPGINLVSNDQSNEGHGTRCTSLVGARNTLAWLVGIAPASKLLSGKISINLEMRSFDFILDGIAWAIGQGAEVISISYSVELAQAGVDFYEKKFEDLIKNKNVLVFAAAGNSGIPQETAERYPASFKGCISVGAIDENAALSSINILSNKTILHAPGINIESIGHSAEPSPQSGTSFSTPIVAAVAGLAISYIKKRNNNTWHCKQVLDKLYETADVVGGNPSKKIINVAALFENLV